MPEPAPILIPSKGRPEIATTPKILDRMGVPWRMIVEEQELAAYRDHWPADRLLVLDPAYQQHYDAGIDLAPGEPRGSGPARNFAWDLAQREGAPWHWVMDDNIMGFYRLHANQRIPYGDVTPFLAMEAFADRYETIALAGPQYLMFAPSREAFPPFVPNRRIMSCILVRTDLPMRWRLRWNEDIDLCLRVLKDGWATVCFNAFLQEKAPTGTFPGGNTDTIYLDGTLEKSRMLVRQHPDVVRLMQRYQRWHHHVDYRPFAGNQLRRRPDYDERVAADADRWGLQMVPRRGLRIKPTTGEGARKQPHWDHTYLDGRPEVKR